MAPNMSNLHILRQHQLRRGSNNPTHDQNHKANHSASKLFAIPERKNEGDDNSTATGNTAEINRELSRSGSLENKPRRKRSNVYEMRGQYTPNFDLEEEEAFIGDVIQQPSPRNDQSSFPPTFDEKMNNPNTNHVQFMDLKEPATDASTQDEYEAILEEYELEIQRLEKLNATLTGNVAALTTCALDGSGRSSEQVVTIVQVEKCLTCGGEHDLNSQQDDYYSMRSSVTSTGRTGSGSSRRLSMDITPNEEYTPLNNDIYNDMILTEEHYIHQISKLQKTTTKLQKNLEKKKKLISQLSMNLKTAAEKITEVGKEKNEWKSKAEELEENQSQAHDGAKDESMLQIHAYQVEVVENELSSLLDLMGEKTKVHAKNRQLLIDEYRSDDAIWNKKLENPEVTLNRVIKRLRKGDQVEDWHDRATTVVAPVVHDDAPVNKGEQKGVNIWDSVTSLFGGPSQQHQQQPRKHEEHVDIDGHPLSNEIRSFDTKNLREAPSGSCDNSDESSSSGSSNCSSDSSQESEEGEVETRECLAAPHAEAAQEKADRLGAEQKAKQERLEKELVRAQLKAEQERLEKEEHLAAEQRAKQERVKLERQAAAQKVEQERLQKLAAEQKAELERLTKELLAARKNVEEERLQKEHWAAEQKVEHGRLEKQCLVAEQKAEHERLEKERVAAERDRLENERLVAEQERLEKERIMAAEQERFGNERLAASLQERLENERLASEQRAEVERLQRQCFVAEQKAKEEKLEKECVADGHQERLEKDRLAADQRAEEERLEKECMAAKQHAEEERLVKERMAAEQERLEEEECLADQRKAEVERLENDRLAAEQKAKQERLERLQRTEEMLEKMAADQKAVQEKLENLAAKERAKEERFKAELLAAKEKFEEERLEKECLSVQQSGAEKVHKITRLKPNQDSFYEENLPKLRGIVLSLRGAESLQCTGQSVANSDDSDDNNDTSEISDDDIVESVDEGQHEEIEDSTSEQINGHEMDGGDLTDHVHAGEAPAITIVQRDEPHDSDDNESVQELHEINDDSADGYGVAKEGTHLDEGENDEESEPDEVAGSEAGETGDERSENSEDDREIAKTYSEDDESTTPRKSVEVSIEPSDFDEMESIEEVNTSILRSDEDSDEIGSSATIESDNSYEADNLEEEVNTSILRSSHGDSDDDESDANESPAALQQTEGGIELSGTAQLEAPSTGAGSSGDPRQNGGTARCLQAKNETESEIGESSVGELAEQSHNCDSDDDDYVAKEAKDEDSSQDQAYYTAHEADEDDGNNGQILDDSDDECNPKEGKSNSEDFEDDDSHDCDEQDASVVVRCEGSQLHVDGNSYIDTNAASVESQTDEIGSAAQDDDVTNNELSVNHRDGGKSDNKEASLEQNAPPMVQPSIAAIGAASNTTTSSEIPPHDSGIPTSINVVSENRRSPTGTIVSTTTAITDGTQARITSAVEDKMSAKLAEALEQIQEQSKARLDGSEDDRSLSYYHNVVSQFTDPPNPLSIRLPRRELFQHRGSSCSDLFVDIVSDVFHKPEDRQVLVASKDIDKYLVPRYKAPVLPPQSSHRSAPSFKKGQKDGYYTYKSSSGNQYAGHWKDGRRHGYGIAKYRDGEVFNGEWRRGRRHGQGVLHLANSDVFDGDWAANKKSGLGVYYWNDGEVDMSWYENDARLESLRWTSDRRRAYHLDLSSSKKEQISLVRAATIVKGWERKRETYEC